MNFIKSCTAYKCGILAILIISFIRSNVPPNNEYPMSTMKYYPTNNILPSSNAKCTCVSFRIQYPQLFGWFFWISFLLSRVESMNDKWLVKFNWLRLWSTVMLLSSLDQNINVLVANLFRSLSFLKIDFVLFDANHLVIVWNRIYDHYPDYFPSSCCNEDILFMDGRESDICENLVCTASFKTFLGFVPVNPTLRSRWEQLDLSLQSKCTKLKKQPFFWCFGPIFSLFHLF